MFQIFNIKLLFQIMPGKRTNVWTDVSVLMGFCLQEYPKGHFVKENCLPVL